MVSIHNTQKYHNYMYDLPEQKFMMIKGSILSFLSENEPKLYELVLNDLSLKYKLNGSKDFTLFVPINNDNVNLNDYLFVGHIILSNTEKIIQTVDNHKRYTATINGLNNHPIIIPNIRCEGGVIHLINL